MSKWYFCEDEKCMAIYEYIAVYEAVSKGVASIE